MEFFRCLAKRRKHGEYWAYDSTSISSYSEQLNQVKYGHNKDHEPLPQLNLLLLYGESSNLPFYYRKLAGNISDVKTVRTRIADVEPLGVKKVKLLMDRGFYSSENIDSMLANHYKFLIGTSTKLAEVKRILLSYIKKQMQEHAMFSKYTMSSLLDELDVIERVHIPGKTPIVREILNKQIQIYKNMAVKPPIDALS